MEFKVTTDGQYWRIERPNCFGFDWAPVTKNGEREARYWSGPYFDTRDEAIDAARKMFGNTADHVRTWR